LVLITGGNQLLAQCVTDAKKTTMVVRSASHELREHDLTSLVPQTEGTSCGVYKNTVYCSDSTTPAHYYNQAWYELYQYVTTPDPARPGQLLRYTLHRRTKWNKAPTNMLVDEGNFAAEIKGKHMYIQSCAGGNWGKRHITKWLILDVQQIWKQLPEAGHQ
jgi:hypothetical protein